MPERPVSSRLKIPLSPLPTGFKRGYDIYPPGYDKFGQSLFYPNKPETFGLETRELAGGRSVRGETRLIKPLRFDSVEELKLLPKYDNGQDQGLDTYIRTTVIGTDIPVYIFDDHNHAAFAICEAHSEGRLFPSATMVHVDEHDDGVVSPSIPNIARLPSLSEVAEIVKYYTDIESFIAPLMRWNLVRDVIWIDPSNKVKPITVQNQKRSIISGYAETEEEIKRVYAPLIPFKWIGISDVSSVLSKVHPMQLILDIDLDYFRDPTKHFLITDHDIWMLKNLMYRASVVTIATSPGYIDQERALSFMRRLPLE